MSAQRNIGNAGHLPRGRQRWVPGRQLRRSVCTRHGAHDGTSCATERFASATVTAVASWHASTVYQLTSTGQRLAIEAYVSQPCDSKREHRDHRWHVLQPHHQSDINIVATLHHGNGLRHGCRACQWHWQNPHCQLAAAPTATVLLLRTLAAPLSGRLSAPCHVACCLLFTVAHAAFQHC
jgi:hypothetical protein